jgi:hypothetical protein
MGWNKEAYRELLEDVCSDYCEKGHYCILKEFLVNSHPSPRLLMQLRAIDKYKLEKSKELDKDIGWDGALQFWLEEGYAKKFGEVYEEGIRFSTLYKKIRQDK